PVPDPIATRPTGIMRTTTMKSIAMRTTREAGASAPMRRRVLAVVAARAFITVSVIAAGIIASSFGGSAAADDAAHVNAAEAKPIVLAGRWSGQYYGYGRQGEARRIAEAMAAC